MQLQQPFNAQAVDPTQNVFSQLPKGKQPVIAVASEIKATADNSGGMVVFELQVIDGPNKGATGPFRINLYSQSDKARAIAESQMSALCHVTGVYLLQDTSQLHNIPFAVDIEEQSLTPQQVEKQQRGESVTPFTQVKKILDINGNEPRAGGAQQAQPQQAPAQQPAQAGGWGGNQQANAQPPAQQAQAPAQGGWGANAPAPAQQAAPSPAPAPASNAGAWQQNAAAGGTPAWGKR